MNEQITIADCPLFKPIIIGGIELPHRIAMASMTRARADPETNNPNELMIKYYTERASDSSFMITECIAISKRGSTIKGGPGIWTQDQINGWKKIVDSVHEKGGKIFAQLYHCGRTGRKITKWSAVKPIGPSKLPLRNLDNTKEKGYSFGEDVEEMDEVLIKSVIEEFRVAALNAQIAGFDAIEIHAANGYLIDQFLRNGTNKRADSYGGNIENRCKFLLEIVDVVSTIFKNERVGVKISPVSKYNDMFDSDPLSIFKFLLQKLDAKNISFVEICDFEDISNPDFYETEFLEPITNIYKCLRPYFSKTIIGNTAFSFEKGNSYIRDGLIDMVTFGRLYISNPDLKERFFTGKQEFNTILFQFMYSGGEEGYIGYPFMVKN